MLILQQLKKYKKIYCDHFGFIESEFIPCEMCEGVAVDIHHIDSKGMGGRKSMDVIENLMALCRECHVEYGDKKQYKTILKEIHLRRLVILYIKKL